MISPLNNIVVIQSQQQQDKTSGGVFVDSQSAKEDIKRGTIMETPLMVDLDAERQTTFSNRYPQIVAGTVVYYDRARARKIAGESDLYFVDITDVYGLYFEDKGE